MTQFISVLDGRLDASVGKVKGGGFTGQPTVIRQPLHAFAGLMVDHAGNELELVSSQVIKKRVE